MAKNEKEENCDESTDRSIALHYITLPPSLSVLRDDDRLPVSETSNGGASMMRRGVRNEECSWNSTFDITWERSSLSAPRM